MSSSVLLVGKMAPVTVIGTAGAVVVFVYMQRSCLLSLWVKERKKERQEQALVAIITLSTQVEKILCGMCFFTKLHFSYNAEYG